MLALRVGRTVSADRLAEGLWGEQPPASAPKMVQLYVSQLRRLLDADGAGIATRGRGYELQLEHGVIDAVAFERLLEQSRAREALALWRGQALADVADEPFAAAEIRRLDELRMRAVEQAIDADLAAGRHTEVIGELEALTEEHPLRERLHAQRMLALYRAGRQAEALNAYREARSALVEQIGVEPGADLRRLHEAILAQDPALEPASPPPTPATPPPSRRVAPVLAIAGLLVFAGVLAFGVSRVTRPDSLAGIAENAVGLIDADSGRITGQYRVGHGPQAVAGGAGSVWVANRLDGTVTRIPSGDGDPLTIDVGGEPSAVAFGAGSLWVADGQGRRVAQVDPDTNKVESTIEVGNAAHAVAVGYDALWVASAVDATVTRIDLNDARPTSIPVEARPSALAAGAGAVWVASEETGRVIRLDPRSGTPVDAIAVGNGPSGVAAGAGAVWVTNRLDGTVSRIDPATGAVTAVTVGREPRAVAAGEEGVWVANAGDGTLMRIDRRDGRVADTVTTGSSPAALAVVDGTVWTAANASAASHRGGTLRASHWVPLPAMPSLIEPAYYFMPASLTHDGLVAYRRTGGSTGGTIVADLASSVPQPSPDGRTYVFRLRPDVRFSNGAPVEPEDVRASIERLFMLPPKYQGFLPEVPSLPGAARCTPARCDLSNAVETDAAARTVTIHLRRPDPDFLHKLQQIFVVPAGTPETIALERAPPGTGPYMVERWNPRRGGALVRNPHFDVWSPDRPDGFPDEITIRFERPSAQVAAVEDGAADIALLPREIHDVTRLRRRHGARLHADPNLGLLFAFLNVRTPPFDDRRVRRALNYAVDRGRVAELNGSQETNTPTCQMLPPGFPGYVPACRYTLDPNPAGTWIAPDLARARRLVAASGTQGMTVEFWGARPLARIGRYFISLLGRLGYRTRLRMFDDLVPLSENTSEGRPQMGLWGWGAVSTAPYDFLKWIVACSGTSNHSRFCDPDLDARMQRAAGMRGPEAIDEWRRIETSLAAQAPTVPLITDNNISLTAERVGNYQYHPLWGPLIEQLWVR
jgi:YVTN family beta-propeller protein